MNSRFIQHFHLKRLNSIKTVLIIVLVLMIFAVLHLLAHLFIPFILALFMAYLIHPMVQKVRTWGVPSPLAIAGVLFLILAIIVSISLLFFKSIQNFIADTAKLDFYEQRLNQIVDEVRELLINTNLIEQEEWFQIPQKLFSQARNYLLNFISSTTSFVSYFILFLFYLLFILPGIKNFNTKINRAYGVVRGQRITGLNQRIIRQLQQYIKAKTIVSSITGISAYLVCLLFGLEFPFIWGTLAFILNFIPNIGSIIATFLPTLLAILQFNNFPQALAMMGALISIQFSLGNILEPRLLSQQLSMSPLVVIISLVVWGWLWGIPGVILSIPIMASFSIIASNFPSLKPIGLLMLSSFPIPEDEERISLLIHMMLADNRTSEKDEHFFKKEFHHLVSNPRYLEKTWKQLKKKPRKLDQIFEDTPPEQTVQLYLLACEQALADRIITENENQMLETIRSIGGIHSDVATLVHECAYISRGIESPTETQHFTLPADSNPLPSLEMLAYSHQTLARNYFEKEKWHSSLSHYKQSLRYFSRLRLTQQIPYCLEMMTIIHEQLEESQEMSR